MKCLLFLLLLPLCVTAQDKVKLGGWTPMFDGKTLEQWEFIDFAGGEASFVTNGVMVIPGGLELSGLRYTGKTPTNHYEVEFEAKRVAGSDFFGALTFPLGSNSATLVIGGWGGGVIGISSIDRLDAAENETTEYINFINKTWYKVRLRISSEALVFWLDDKQIFDVDLTNRSVGMRAGEIEASAPFGLSTFMTTGHLRHIRYRSFTPVPRP